MGCASSTPMIAAPGSEILKNAKQVAADAAKSGEVAVQDVTHSLGKSLDAAKETVGHAVTDITNDLGNAFKEKSDMLDDAKNNLMGKLQLGTAEQQNSEKHAIAETEIAKEQVTGKNKINATNENDDDNDNDNDAETERVDEIPTRAPTPTHDADSLKTSTPEPEIEQALAKFMADSPPTPKPTFAELEKLTTEAVDKPAAELLKETEALKQQVEQHAEQSVEKTVEKVSADETTEKATESSAPAADNSKLLPPTELQRPSTTEWEKYADMLGQHRKFNPGDAFKRGGKFRTALDMKPVLAPGTHTTDQHTTAQHTTELTRALDLTRPTYEPLRINTALKRVRDHSDSGLSDNNNNNNNSYSSPLHAVKCSSARSAIQHGRQLPRTLNAANTKKFQHEFASLIGCEPSKLSQTAVANKSRAQSRVQSRTASRTPSRAPSRVPSRAPSRTPSRVPSRAPSPAKLRSASRSTTRSSNKSSPQLSRSSTLASLFGGSKHKKANSKPTTKMKSKQQQSLPLLQRAGTNLKNQSAASRSRSPALLNGDVSRVVSTTPVLVGMSRSPSRAMNSSTFMSSPRASPFSIRKNYCEFEEQENKAAFVTDLSSITNNRNRLNASPYKIRERCAVCYNKYVIK